MPSGRPLPHPTWARTFLSESHTSRPMYSSTPCTCCPGKSRPIRMKGVSRTGRGFAGRAFAGATKLVCTARVQGVVAGRRTTKALPMPTLSDHPPIRQTENLCARSAHTVQTNLVRLTRALGAVAGFRRTTRARPVPTHRQHVPIRRADIRAQIVIAGLALAAPANLVRSARAEGAETSAHAVHTPFIHPSSDPQEKKEPSQGGGPHEPGRNLAGLERNTEGTEVGEVDERPGKRRALRQDSRGGRGLGRLKP
eukprot:1578219-Rhodomonas_salina.1